MKAPTAAHIHAACVGRGEALAVRHAMLAESSHRPVEKAADMFNIGLTPRHISTDFEKATINAFEQVFPSAVVTGCHFHLGQSVMRKVEGQRTGSQDKLYQ